MADDSEKKDESMSAFNSAFSYFDLLNVLEKGMLQGWYENNYVAFNKLLDMYWVMIHEWFDTKEEEELHDNLRIKQKEAHNIVMNAIKGNGSVSTAVIEVYVQRWIALLKSFHNHGMRMPKKDDEGDVGILNKRARLRY